MVMDGIACAMRSLKGVTRGSEGSKAVFPDAFYLPVVPDQASSTC